MFIVVLILTFMGGSLGILLGIAARFFKVEEDPLQETVENLLPGANCGQCGYPGCAGAAVALVNGEASVTCCPPGGKQLIEDLAEALNVPITGDVEDVALMIASIDESLCTGCTRCYRACPTDAIIGATGQIHRVITDACTGCAKCETACPEDCVALSEEVVTLDSWQWSKPSIG